MSLGLHCSQTCYKSVVSGEAGTQVYIPKRCTLIQVNLWVVTRAFIPVVNLWVVTRAFIPVSHVTNQLAITRLIQLICNMFDCNESLETWFNIYIFSRQRNTQNLRPKSALDPDY